MSFLYSVIKSIVRKKVKGSSLHQEESYEELKQASYDIVTVQRSPIYKTSHRQTAVAGFVYRAIFDGYYLWGRWTVTKILNSKKITLQNLNSVGFLVAPPPSIKVTHFTFHSHLSILPTNL